jgi:arylsulfatase A-like enzyme
VAADLGWDGVDRWAAIAGTGDLVRPRPLCIVHQSGRAVYGGDWKLILRKKGPVELYDIAADPGESLDRAAEQPAVVERLTAIAAADAARDATALPADPEGVPER